MPSQQLTSINQSDFFSTLVKTTRHLVSYPESLIEYVMAYGLYLDNLDNENFQRPIETFSQKPRDIKYHQERKDYLIKLFIEGNLRDSKIAAISLQTNSDYQNWAKQAIAELANHQNIKSSNILENIYKELINSGYLDDIKMWNLAIKNDDKILYVNSQKEINNLFEAISLSGMITYGWGLKDAFTGIIVDYLELYQKSDSTENASA